MLLLCKLASLCWLLMRCEEEFAADRLTVRLFPAFADLVLLYLAEEASLTVFVLRPLVDTFDLVLVDELPVR